MKTQNSISLAMVAHIFRLSACMPVLKVGFMHHVLGKYCKIKFLFIYSMIVDFSLMNFFLVLFYSLLFLLFGKGLGYVLYNHSPLCLS